MYAFWCLMMQAPCDREARADVRRDHRREEALQGRTGRAAVQAKVC